MSPRLISAACVFLDIILTSVCAAVFFTSKNVSDVDAEVLPIRTCPDDVMRTLSVMLPPLGVVPILKP